MLPTISLHHVLLLAMIFMPSWLLAHLTRYVMLPALQIGLSNDAQARHWVRWTSHGIFLISFCVLLILSQ